MDVVDFAHPGLGDTPAQRVSGQEVGQRGCILHGAARDHRRHGVEKMSALEFPRPRVVRSDRRAGGKLTQLREDVHRNPKPIPDRGLKAILGDGARNREAYGGRACGVPSTGAKGRERSLLTFLAVDIGGTFTDLVGFDPMTSRFFHAKSLTTPNDFSQGIVDCIGQSGLDLAKAEVLIHGTTVAINTLIERTGAKTALLVTRGTRDVYIIGRGNRP
ncbi:MAG: hypothetical protein OXI64_10970, partial [Defluviicoccus sp.]|nr:hypothetical protein [Defluviicoccus sp.]